MIRLLAWILQDICAGQLCVSAPGAESRISEIAIRRHLVHRRKSRIQREAFLVTVMNVRYWNTSSMAVHVARPLLNSLGNVDKRLAASRIQIRGLAQMRMPHRVEEEGGNHDMAGNMF